MTKLYNDYDSYLKERYGEKVYRVGIDAGLSCPNRDGTKGVGGCIYCDGIGSRAPYADPKDSIHAQLKKRIEYLKKEKGINKFIAYFQAFTNTYASPEKLKEIYDNVLEFHEIIGISIGTRPDAIDEDKLRLISSYKDRYEVWIEYGLQTSNDDTLKLLNRGHTYSDFAEAVRLAKRFGIKVCSHVILGLPGETRGDMVQTAMRLNELGIDGVKIHPLHVLKGSELERSYLDGKVKILSQDEYVGLACDFLENLSPQVIVQRLTGHGSRETHVAPDWALDKLGTIEKIGNMLKKRGSYQGFKLAGTLEAR